MLKLKYQETIHLIYNFIISKAFVLSAENGTDQKNEAYFTWKRICIKRVRLLAIISLQSLQFALYP